MHEDQRLLLEAYLRSQKAHRQSDHPAKPKGSNSVVTPVRALCDRASAFSGQAHYDPQRHRGRGGIYKSGIGDTVYGYYAKAGFKNLVFCTRTRRDLADTVRDHILLTTVLERIRCDNTGDGLPGKVCAALSSVLHEEGLTEHQLLRSVAVGISAHHWIGRVLWVHRLQLESALDAWRCHDDARGCALFIGSAATAAYTPGKAREQWSRVREVFIKLQTDDGRRQRSQVDLELRQMEASYRLAFERKTRRFQQQIYRQQERQATRVSGGVDPNGARLHRCERLIRSWRRAIDRKTKPRKHAAVNWTRNKRGRWDGKESLDEFQRRVRGRTAST